jgi:hypothetical protein
MGGPVTSSIHSTCAIGVSASRPFVPLSLDSPWFLWTAGLGVVSLVLTLVLMPVVVARLPADHFVRKRRAKPKTTLGWIGFVGKNVLGWVCIAAGVAMLVLPGQGVITLLIGLMLVNFPGKRRLELALVRRPKIRKFLDKMREKRGKEPFELGPSAAPAASPS